MSRRYNKQHGGRGETQQLDAISYRLHQAEKQGYSTNDRSMLNVTVAGSSAIQQSNNSITAGLISSQPNEMKSIEQAMAQTSFFSPKISQ